MAIGTTADTAAAGNHTHTTTIAASESENQISLAANTRYAITAGGTSYVFTTPSDTTYSSGTGISIGVNNAINHSNSVTAQTTQAVYPIKIDAQGHISEYGTAITIGTAAGKDVPTSGNASSTQIVLGNDSRLSDSRTPTSHAHGNVSNTGTLTDTAAAAAGNDYVVIRDADNNSIQTSTIKGVDVKDAVDKKHSHSDIVLSTTAQTYDGSHTIALPSSNPYDAASSTHTHGNITNGGELQTTDITIASGDKLVVTDASDSGKIARTSVEFDGSTTTKALTQKGTFETFVVSGDLSTYALDADYANIKTICANYIVSDKIKAGAIDVADLVADNAFISNLVAHKVDV